MDALQSARDAATAALADNLRLARDAAGMTQAQLAEAAGVSRATVAQLEGGIVDPRLSTISDIAAALGTNPILLLMGEREIRALVDAVTSSSAQLVSIDDVGEMRQLLASGLEKKRVAAARLGARAAKAAGLSAAGAAVGSVLLPGVGTVLGAALGAFFGDQISRIKVK